MAKDFALLAEAYTSIYEDGEITGVVSSPLASSTNTTQQFNKSTKSQSINLQVKDSSKLIKNLNDIYLKLKENLPILISNNVAGAKEQFDSQKLLMGQTIASIISFTSDSSSYNVYNELIGGLDKDLLPFVPKRQPKFQ